MVSEFFKTIMGRKFYDSDVPRIAKSLERIADQLEVMAGMMQSNLKKETKDDTTQN